jgi:endonuclease G, mitochondrial
MNIKKLFALLSFTVYLSACSKSDLPEPIAQTSQVPGKYSASVHAISLSETFESGSKSAYAVANVTLTSGSWNLNNALIGTTASDRKVGTKSVRITSTGIAGMNFDAANGAATVTVKHAKYGTDGTSTWELWMSSNAGSSYLKVGSTVTTSSTTLQTASFTVNATGSVRFQIRKITGASYRINIDDFSIDDTSGGTTPPPAPGDGNSILLGNPSNATADILNPTNYLMEKSYFAMSYHRDRGIPNWVSWYVGSTSVGSTPRQDDFRADTSLPLGWYQVGNTSYSGSGFDRGHNCPSGDRTSSVAANSTTFLMTNMIPQAPVNNQQTWANLENYARTLITAGNEVYIVMGCYGTGGTGSTGTFNTINGGNVTVPNRVWKVIVVIPNGTNDLSRITSSTRVIAINTPNINTTSSDWKTYRTSVDAIESATGYDLLSNVSATIQATIESKVDNL